MKERLSNWSRDDAMLNVLLVWAVRDPKCSSADSTRKHLDGKSAPEDCSLSTRSSSAVRRGFGEGIDSSTWVGGGTEINQTTLRSSMGKGFSQTPAQTQTTQARALYIILSKSDHVQVLQCARHLSFTHLSLLQGFALHEHPGIRGGGKKKGALHRNFHALGSVN